MIKQLILYFSFFLFLYGCSSTRQAADSEISAEQTVKKDTVDFGSLLVPPENWHHLDEEETLFRGVSSQLAYQTRLRDMSPSGDVVVAVIDGGVDITHEDLDDVLWINENEIPGNGKDDDQNGYVDDIHGWNFIGGPDGENVNHDTFELTRIYRQLHSKFEKADTSSFNKQEQERYDYYNSIRSDYEQKVNELEQQYNNIQSLEQAMEEAENILSGHYMGKSYSYEDLQKLEPDNQQLAFAKNVMSYVMENDIDSVMISDQKKQIYEFAKYGYNPDYETRHIIGDNYEDKSERFYGNNDVAGPDPGHGTHVAGIIAAERNNGIGVDGVATGLKIMAIRAVPNGDERDKDVANAIRYAVDNGADIINMSFGKGYSPHKEVVDEAIRYADEHGVLMVHGAGNDAKNTDQNESYPTKFYGSTLSDSAATLWLGVGATSWKPDEEFIASFSNYGKKTVDVFAPGVDIYSTMPGNEYERQGGTSMASPVVAGTAALIMAYYPDLTAEQVRDIILNNTIQYQNQEVLVPNQGDPQESELRPFSSFSVTGGVVNVNRALEAAESISNQ